MNIKYKFLSFSRKYYLVLTLFLVLFASIFVSVYLVQRPKNIREGSAATLPGDVNDDGVVDIIDFQLLSNTFGKSSGQTGYDARADFNSDNVVDILDFQILSNNFGKVATTGTVTPTPTTPPGSGQIILNESFEYPETVCTSTGCKIGSWPVRIDITGSGVSGFLAVRPYTQLAVPPKSGNSALEVHTEKNGSSAVTRAELDKGNYMIFALKTEYWVGYSIFLPNDGSYNFDSKLPEILQQDRFTDDSCTGSGGSPSFALRPQYGRWRLDVRWDATNCNHDGQQIYETELGSQVRGVWTNFIERLYFSPDTDGIIQIWKWEDGNSVPQSPQLTRFGPNYYHNSVGPYFKMGLYKSAWANSSDVNTRTIYYDSLKVFRGTQGFNFVKP